MNFDESPQAIYLQIVDKISNDILDGRIREGDKLPSAREYAMSVEVNPNTAMRAYEHLVSLGIAVSKRGLGYHITDGARDIILKARREKFFSSDMNQVFYQLKHLNVSPDQLKELYTKYLSE